MYSYSEQSRCFWNRYNIAWLFQNEQSNERTMPSTAVCSVRELRYQVIWTAVYMPDPHYLTWVDHPNCIWHNTNYEAFQYVIFSSLLMPPHPQAQILSSASISQTPLFMFFPQWERPSSTLIKPLGKVTCLYIFTNLTCIQWLVILTSWFIL
jgi:hypothetical protein